MSKPRKVADNFVGEEDIVYIKEATVNNRLEGMIHELVSREPEIAFAVSDHFERTIRLLKSVPMSTGQRMALERRITLLTWCPLLTVVRGHRRAWDDFLPSTATAPEQNGGGK